MNVLACFKISESLDEVTDNEWNHCLDNTEIPVFMENALGTYDEAALETALQIRDQASEKNIPVELTAFTFGSELPDVMTSRLFGIKYDRIVHMLSDEDIRFKPDAAACAIERFIKESGGYDIVLMGQQASPGDNASTHIMTASRLSLPCVLNVVDVRLETDGLNVTSIVDGGILEQKLKTPVILGVGDARHPYLRVATLRERMAASKKKADIRDTYENLCDIRGAEINAGLYREIKTRSCKMIEGDSVKEKIRTLYEQVIKNAVKGAR